MYALERALQVRHWTRDRETDEMVLPYFEQLESYQNPLLGKRHGLDREQSRPVVDEFYTLHGWDIGRGWPTQERSRDAGLADLYGPTPAFLDHDSGRHSDDSTKTTAPTVSVLMMVRKKTPVSPATWPDD